MLKTLGIIAAIGAVIPAIKRDRLRVIDGGRAIDVTPILAPVAASLPRRSIDAKTAVAAFLTDMIEFGGGCEFQVRHVLASYDQMRTAKSWPAITIKALSSEMVRLGCTRGQLDCRKSGGGRPSTLILPDKIRKRRA